jgi:hypothetical protein
MSARYSPGYPSLCLVGTMNRVNLRYCFMIGQAANICRHLMSSFHIDADTEGRFCCTGWRVVCVCERSKAKEWRSRVSIPVPADCEPTALPSELHPPCIVPQHTHRPHHTQIYSHRHHQANAAPKGPAPAPAATSITTPTATLSAA